MAELTFPSVKQDRVFNKLPLPPSLIPSTIIISSPSDLGLKRDNFSPNSVALLDLPVQVANMSLKPPLHSPEDARCIMSPTDLPQRSDSPSLQMKDIYMRRFLGEIADKCL